MKRCRACLTVNENRFRKCQACGKPLPKRRRPAHLAALKQPYEVYVALNDGSENCAVCGRPPGSRRNHRDHDHRTGEPRGILCFRHNSMIDPRATAEEFEGLAAYLRRHEARRAA